LSKLCIGMCGMVDCDMYFEMERVYNRKSYVNVVLLL